MSGVCLKGMANSPAEGLYWDRADPLPDRSNCPLGPVPRQAPEHQGDLFEGGEVRSAGRPERRMSASGWDRGVHALAVVASTLVRRLDIASHRRS